MPATRRTGNRFNEGADLLMKIINLQNVTVDFQCLQRHCCDAPSRMFPKWMISWNRYQCERRRQPRAGRAVVAIMSLSATFPAGLASPRWLEGSELQATQQARRALEAFLADVERRAFRIAQIALRHEEDALDVVQEAMLRLAKNYSARPAEEWKPPAIAARCA